MPGAGYDISVGLSGSASSGASQSSAFQVTGGSGTQGGVPHQTALIIIGACFAIGILLLILFRK